MEKKKVNDPSIKNFRLIPLEQFKLDPSSQFQTGGYGKLIKASYNSTNVVMKTIWGKIHDSELKKLDAKIGTLKHPNLVEILGLVHSAAVISPSIIVSPFMKNGSLLNFISKNDLNKKEMGQMCEGIVNGMIYLHSREIIHRILCAENVLLDELHKPKISDYGIAEAVNPNPNLMNKKKYYGNNGSILFPPVRIRWVPNECIPTNRNDVLKFSQASDVWSFGVLLFELWGRGKIPYGEERKEDEVIRIIKGRSNPLFIKPLPMPKEVTEMCYLIFCPHAEKRPTFPQILSWFADPTLFLANVKSGVIKRGNPGPRGLKEFQMNFKEVQGSSNEKKPPTTVTAPLPSNPPFPVREPKIENNSPNSSPLPNLDELKNAPENSASFSNFLFQDEKSSNGSNGLNSIDDSNTHGSGATTPGDSINLNDLENGNCANSQQCHNLENSKLPNAKFPDAKSENCKSSNECPKGSKGIEIQNEVMQLCLSQLKIMEKMRNENSALYLNPFFNNPYCFNPFILLDQMTPMGKSRKEEELEEKVKVLEKRISTLETELNIP